MQAEYQPEYGSHRHTFGQGMGTAQSGESGIEKHLASGPEVADPNQVTLTPGKPARFVNCGIIVGEDAW
jgi:hypothetical protein